MSYSKKQSTSDWIRYKSSIKPKVKVKKKKSKPKKKVDQRVLYKKKYHDYLMSNDWAKIKLDLYQTRDRKCEQCGSTTKIQVHHMTYVNVFKEEPSDLIILCAECHQKEHAI